MYANLMDVCDLLDGRLKQLTKFIVQVEFLDGFTWTSCNMVSLFQV